MTADNLRSLFRYHYWANARIFATLSQLTDDEFGRTIAGSYGSLRNTLVHMLSAEWGWLDRCGGPPRGAKLDPGNYPSPASLIAAWGAVERDMTSLLGKLTDDDTRRTVEFSLGAGAAQRRTVGQLLWHAANHATHHRGQVAMLMRLIDKPVGDFDVLFFD
jgi:uncharacterized damage-inducible protein DinB